MGIDKKQLISSSLLLTINLIFTILFFQARNYFNADPILLTDHPGHYAYSIIYSTLIIPIFQSSYGFLYNIYCGYPFIHLFPPGFFWCIYLLTSLGVSFSIAYKVFLFSIVLFFGMFPYLVLRKKCRNIVIVIITFWNWLAWDTYTILRFDSGGIQFLCAAFSTILLLMQLIQKDHTKSIAISSSWRETLPIFWIFLIAVMNYTALYQLFIICSEQILFKFVKERKLTTEIRNMLKYYIKIAIGSLLLFGFWLIPTIINQFPYIQIHESFYLYTFANSMWFSSNYITQVGFVLIFVIEIILFIGIKNFKSPIISLFLLLAINSLIYVFLLPYTKNLFFVGVNSYRQIAYFEMCTPLLIAYFLEDFIHELKTQYKEKRMQKPKKKVKIAILFCECLLLIGISFNLGSVQMSRQIEKRFGTQEEYHGEWDAKDLDLITWITTNTTKESRILLQNSGDLTGNRLSSGHNSLYLALITDRYFASGYSSEWHYTYAAESNFLDDLLYGKDISNWTLTELQNYFIYYNIEYMVVWSRLAKQTFQTYSNFDSSIQMTYNNSKYYVFKILNATKSYIISNDSISVKNFQIEPKKIGMNVTADHQNSRITVSMHDYTNWVIYVNHTRVLKQQNDLGLIQFTIPIGYENCEIELIWEKTAVEYGSEAISVITCLGLICCPIYLKKKKSHISKDEQDIE